MFCLILTQGFALAIPQLLRIATDALVAKDGSRVMEAAGGMILVALLGALNRVCSRVLIFNSGRKVEYDIRNEIFGHLERLDPSFYERMPLAQVMSRMVNDLSQVRLLLGPGILNLTNTALVYIVVIPLLLYTDWKLTLYSLSTLPVLLMLGRVFARRIYSLSREAQERLGALSSKVQENLGGAMTVRAYRQQAQEEARFFELNSAYLETNIKLARLRGIMFPMMGMAGAIGGIVLLYVGGQRIASGAMTVGEFVEFNAYLAALTWPTIALGWMISLWQRGMAAMERINDIFSAEPSLKDGQTQAPTFEGRLEVRDLRYVYPGQKAPSLEDVNCTINRGETIVIVGKTGSGKSTLLKAIARLLEVEDGMVSIDGVDVNTLPLSHVRGSIGYAPQDAFLFSRSLEENVAFGRPEASLEEIENAVRIASLDTDVSGFPEGLGTLVGERGVTLSGGQRQRTTLARAILVDAPILLLDDTLSAVDTETETRILEELMATPRTIVVATHRLAFAQRADRILVLEGGKLVEQGNEAELLALEGRYHRMHRRQRLRQAMEVKDEPQGASV